MEKRDKYTAQYLSSKVILKKGRNQEKESTNGTLNNTIQVNLIRIKWTYTANSLRKIAFIKVNLKKESGREKELLLTMKKIGSMKGTSQRIK